MKYLKLYESNNSKCYWLLPLEYIGLALQKINVTPSQLSMDQREIDELENHQFLHGYQTLIITKNDEALQHNFDWFYNDVDVLKELRDRNYKFMGKIEVDPEEVQLYKNSKKFGL